jgi:hypothetical protein
VDSHNESPATALLPVAGRAIAVITALVWILLSAAPAFADEFEIGILVDPAVSDSTFVEGFQLAVNQSPDVSHPAGVEGGDHLGSMDVVMVVVDDATSPDELRAAAARLAEGQGVAIIVADIAPGLLNDIAGPIAGAGTMLIVMSDIDAAATSASPLLFAAANQGDVSVLLTDRTPSFQNAFFAAYGRAPSEAAARGYIAGRLVDAGVEATDRDPSDTQTLAAGMAAALGITTTPPTVDETVAPNPPVPTTVDTPAISAESEPSDRPQVSSGLSGALVALVLVGLVAFGGLGVRSRLRRSRPSAR